MRHELYDTLARELSVDPPPVQPHERFDTLKQRLAPGVAVSIFGAGGAGRQMKGFLESRGLEVTRFLDNNPALEGTEAAGLPVSTPGRLGREALRDQPVVIASMYFAEIAAQLRRDFGLVGFEDFFTPQALFFEDNVMRNGYNAELEAHAIEHWDAIQRTAALWADADSRWRFWRYVYLRLYLLTPERLEPDLFVFQRQGCREAAEMYRRLEGPLKQAFAYTFSNNLYDAPDRARIPIPTGGTAVDGGAWHGDTTLDFAVQAGPTGKVIAFEPSVDHCAALRATAARLGLTERIRVEAAGLWRHDGTIRFVDSEDAEGAGSYVAAKGEREIPVRALDSVLAGERVDYLKLDVEGSELAALEGAVDTVRRWRPNLAICLYHKPEDLHEIPLFLDDLGLGYRFHFRHGGVSPTDAVLYGSCQR